MAPKKRSSRVNWAQLNPDLLIIISKKLCDIPSFICFQAVCKRWRAATSGTKPPVQFPCFMDWPKGKGKLDSTFRIYSINSGRTHTFEVPGAHIYGPSDGHVLLYEWYRSRKERRSFLNPLSWEERFVPLEVSVDVRPIRLGCNLIRNDEHVFCYQGDEHYILCFWQSEKNKWIEMRVPLIYRVSFYDHKFFIAEIGYQNKRIRVIDEATGDVLSSLPPPDDFYYRYLIASDDGLLAVELKGCKSILSSLTSVSDLTRCQFKVFRLENYPQDPCWIQLSGIGDLMLFLDEHNCFSMKASDLSGFKGNCIYFITYGSKFPKKGYEHVIGRFDMESNKTERVPAPAWLGTRIWERQAAGLCLL